MAGDSVLEIQARADFSSLFRESQKAADAVTSSAAQIATAMNSAGNAPNKLTFSTMEARHALMGMGEEIGVKMPRFVSTFVSHLDGVGPALAGAFSAVAVIGIIQVLDQVPGAIDKVIGKFTGWDEAAKKTYADIVKGNLDAMKSSVELANQIQAVNLIGLTGSAKYAQEIRNAGSDQARLAGLSAQYLGMQRDLEEQISKLEKNRLSMAEDSHHLQGTGLGEVAATGYEYYKIGQRIEDLKSQLGGLQSASAAVVKELRELSLVKKPTLGAEESSAAKKEAEEATKRQATEEERAAKEAARAQHEQIIAELDDLERAAKERTKLLEEEVRANREANKEMDHEAEQAAKGIERAYEKAWEAVVRAQNKANKQTEEANKKLQEQWNHALAPVNRAFDQMIDGLLRGNVRIGEIFRNLGISMLTPILTAFEKAIEAQIVYSLTSGAIGKEHALAGIMRDAYKAAANVYAEVPFPLNIPAAAGVFATVVALGGGMPSAAGGWDVPSTGGFAMLHPNEMVLPSHLAENVRQGGGAGGGAGGGVHVHFNVNAVDAPGVQAFFDQHGEKMARTLSRQMRRRNSF